MNNWYTKIRRQNDDFISKNISLQSKRTLQLEKKNTQFNLESRNNTNKIYPNVLKKKNLFYLILIYLKLLLKNIQIIFQTI